MKRFSNRLDNVNVATPCLADRDSMFGNERVRFCGQCSLNVYNLSEMSRGEAESLIARTEGRLCVRYYRRKDGSIITQDCPVGLRALKRRASRIRRAVASSVLGFLAGIGVTGGISWFEALLADAYRPLTVSEVQGAIIAQPSREPVPEVGRLIEEHPTMGRALKRNRRR